MSTEMITVLFTDLVGSTELLSRVGEDQGDALRRDHFALLRAVITETGGREIKNVGDGVMVVFSSASAAVAAAVAMQQRIEIRNRRAEERLMVRVGISVGDAENEDGDYFGTPVVEAARLCAAAEGGQVVTTEIVRVLTGSRGGHHFEPLGMLALKGLNAPIPACSVRWERLAERAAWGVPLPGRLEPSANVFVGRFSEFDALSEAFKQMTASTRAPMVLVSGEPGIGKSSLVGALARMAYGQDAVVLYGRCDEELAVPYQPWSEALRHLVTHAPEPWLRGVRPEITRLVPEIRERRLDLVAPSTSDADAERYGLFAAVIELLAAVSHDAPMVLVLDDLHWADRPTTELLRHLGTSDVPMRVLVVGTFRDADIGPSHPLTDTLAAFHRDEASTRIVLRGLADTELLELMEQSAGHELDEDGLTLRDALLAETDGNPFFVVEILRHLAETNAITQRPDGHWVTTSELRATGLPVSVREVLGRRVAHLGETAMGVLSAASVIGRDFDLDTLISLLDQDENRLLDLLDHAVTANLLNEVAPGRFTFAHALVEHALYEEVGSTRRARLHRRVAEIIEQQTGGEPGDRIGELAHHWAEAVAPQDPSKAVTYARQAGDHALARLAPDEAVRWYRQALDMVDRSGGGEDALRCALLVGLGDAQRQTGDPAFRQTLLDAGHLADRIDDTPLLVAAALANNRGFFSSSGVVDHERVEVLRLALDRIDMFDTTSRALLLALLASELLWTGELAERRAVADEAIAVARASGDPSTTLRVLNLVYGATWTPDNLEERLERSREAVALARELRDEVGEFFALTFTIACLYECAQPVVASIERMHEIAEHLGQPTLEWVTRWVDSVEGTRMGDSELAERAAEAALAIGSAAGQPDALIFYGIQLAYVRWLQGRRAELVPLLSPLLDELDEVPAFLPLLAACQLDAGDADGARELLTRELPRLADDPADFTALGGIVFWSHLAGQLADRDAASQLMAKLASYDHLVSFNGVALQGPVADALGRLATVLGDHDRAERYFDIADTLSRRLDDPFFIARARLHRAEMQIQRDRPGDCDEARSNCDAVRDLARRHGFAGLERDAETVSARLSG
jgi:class 3 adenylate cyclase